MATKLSPSTPCSKLHRGAGLEADTTPPLVKTTSSMFAENSPKRRTLVSRGTELSQVQEELAKTKEQLALTEKSKANLLQDLARSKRQVEDLTAKLQDATEVSKKGRMRAELEMEHASFTAAEDWQVEVEVMREQYEAAILELEANKQTMDSLKHEMIMCMEAKNEAVRLAGEAMNAAESTALRVEDLSAKLLAARKAMVAENSVFSKGGGKLKREDSCLQHEAKKVAAPCEESSQEKAAISPVATEIELNSSSQESVGASFDSKVLNGDEAVTEKSQMHLMDPKSVLDCLQAELRRRKPPSRKCKLKWRAIGEPEP